MGHKDFVSLASWPAPDESKVDFKAEENEALVMSLLEDTQNIVQATGIKPKKICFYVAAPWKWKVYVKALEKSVSAKISQGDLIKDLVREPDLKAKAKEVAEFVNKIVDEANRTSGERKQRLTQVGVIDESQTLMEAKNFLERELNAGVSFYNEDDKARYDPKNKARTAKPYRPAIFIE